MKSNRGRESKHDFTASVSLALKRRSELVELTPGADQSIVEESEPDNEPSTLQPPLEPLKEVSEINTRLIRITRPFRIRWDLFTMVLAIYTCITVPLFVAFEYKENDYLFSINTIIDFVFIADSIMNFFTTYINSNGDEVTDLRQISRNYLKFMFWVDFISCFPIDNFLMRWGPKSNAILILNLSDLVRLIRILRLGRIIRYMRARDEAKALMKLGQVTLYLLIWIHLTACIWWALARRNGDWIPVPDFVTMTTTVFDDDLFTRYFTAFYHANWLLKGNEVGPKDTTMAFFASVLIIAGSLITAILFGEMAVLMSNLNRRQTQFQTILDSSLTTMENMKLPKELCNRILDYLTTTQSSLSAQEEYETFQKFISPSLQRQVSACIYDPIISMNSILRKEQRASEFIVHKLANHFTKPEEEIITEGTEANALFYIVNGEVKVFVSDQFNEKKFVCYLGKGAHFGEVGLVYNTPRTATIESIGYCTIAMLLKKDYEAAVSRFPQLVEKLRKTTVSYDDPWKKFLLETLSLADYFTALPPDVFQELAYIMEVNKYETGAYLFKPGEEVTKLYLVAEGSVELAFTMNERHLHMLKKQNQIKNMEDPPKIAKKAKSIESFEAWRVDDFHELDALKPRAEVVPYETSRGVTGACAIDENSPEQTNKIGDYPQEVVIATLSGGSLLCHNLILFTETQQLQCKALKQATVYSLRYSVLESMMKDNPDFLTEIKRHKQAIEHYDKERDVKTKLYSAADYDSLAIDSYCPKYWKAEIVRVVLESRDIRRKGGMQIIKLVPKIKAILACEEAGNFDLAQRVIKDEIPPHYITDDGNLDRAAIAATDNATLPNSHPVIQLFKRIYRDVIQPEGTIVSQYNALERVVTHQNRQLNIFRRQLHELKSRLESVLTRVDSKAAARMLQSPRPEPSITDREQQLPPEPGVDEKLRSDYNRLEAEAKERKRQRIDSRTQALNATPDLRSGDQTPKPLSKGPTPLLRPRSNQQPEESKDLLGLMRGE
jgi:CRP-like cAMP-binding protein